MTVTERTSLAWISFWFPNLVNTSPRLCSPRAVPMAMKAPLHICVQGLLTVGPGGTCVQGFDNGPVSVSKNTLRVGRQLLMVWWLTEGLGAPVAGPSEACHPQFWRPWCTSTCTVVCELGRVEDCGGGLEVCPWIWSISHQPTRCNF
jgi:hypothetical protein